MRLGKYVIGILVLTLTAFLITEIAEARFRGGFYRSQQSYRYNSASSNYAARQARFATQTRLRTQQNAMRQQQVARRQAMRTQQTQMRNRMRTRQQQAVQKRNQMALRQKKMLQQRQERMARNRGARAPNTAKLQKEFQRRNALKRERLEKERKDRLRRLEEKRKRDADKQSKDSRDTTTMAALLTRRALPSASTTARLNSSTSLSSLKNFRELRTELQKNNSTQALSSSRKKLGESLRKTRVTQNTPVNLSKRLVRNNSSNRSKNSTFDKKVLARPAFAPGSAGAAKAWTKKSTLKYFQLPTKGKIRYVPPKKWHPGQDLPRGPNGGIMDRNNNEWLKGPSRTKGQHFEWDVQLSRTGKSQLGHLSKSGRHINVSLDGRVTH